MKSSVQAITFDCANAIKLSAFWSGVFGIEVDAGNGESGEFFQSIGLGGSMEPAMMFIQVPEGKTAKNRMHLDLSTADMPGEVARLVDLGASVVHEKNEYSVHWTTLTDPEGNEFCVSHPHSLGDPPHANADS